MVSLDSIVNGDGCVRVTDVLVIDIIRSYRNRENVWVDVRCAAYSPGLRL